jgi:predicted MFS family arabinose efflux permease
VTALRRRRAGEDDRHVLADRRGETVDREEARLGDLDLVAPRLELVDPREERVQPHPRPADAALVGAQRRPVGEVGAQLLARLAARPRAERPRGGFASDLRAGWSVFRSRTWLWSVVLAFALSNALWAAWSALGPVVARDHLGGAPAWGAVLSAMGIGGVLGGIASIRSRARRPLLLFTLTGFVFAVPLVLLALRAPVPVLAAAALLSGVSLMYGNTVWESTLQRHVPAESLSRVSAYDWFGSLAFYPLGLALWGPVAAAIGVSPALWLAFALWTAVLLALLAVPEVRRLTNESSGDAEPVEKRVVGTP